MNKNKNKNKKLSLEEQSDLIVKVFQVSIDTLVSSGLEENDALNGLLSQIAVLVDPSVLEELGIEPEKNCGFAAALGVERFCMVRHGIDDIRKLYTSDLRFLEQF